MKMSKRVSGAMTEAISGNLTLGTTVKYVKGHEFAGLVGLIVDVKGNKADIMIGGSELRREVPVSALELA